MRKKTEKKQYIGISLSPNSNNETGIVVIDDNNEIILLEKKFKIEEIQELFSKIQNLENSYVCVSLAWDSSMLNGRWRILSKPYHRVSSSEQLKNRDNWTQRYSNRGKDFFDELKKNVKALNRFEIYLTREALNLYSGLKERSPADCKFLQNELKTKYKIQNLTSNMMPMAQLEALVGAVLAQKIANGIEEKVLFEFDKTNVVNI
jgi:hypothetical protein